MHEQAVTIHRMNKTVLLLASILFHLLANAQNDVLLLQKKGKTKQTFFTGRYISLQTRQGNFADGIITRIQSDTIYIRHFDIQQTATSYGGIYFDTVFRYTTAIHYHDIGALMSQADLARRKGNAIKLFIAAGGVLVLGAVNGLYRGDPVKEWYTTSGYVVAGTLTVLGILKNRSANPRILIGKKYSLKILTLDKR